MIRVFVTDDHELLREGIKKVLKEELDIRVTGEARTASQRFNEGIARTVALVPIGGDRIVAGLRGEVAGALDG